MALQPDAGTVTVRQTLDMLDADYAHFACGVGECRYTFWLGSGISRERVDGLEKLIPRVMEFLRSKVEIQNAECPYKHALDESLDLAGLTAADKATIDFAQPVVSWPDREGIFKRLEKNYSHLLGIIVGGQAPDHLLWDGVKVVETYGNPATKPDAEHFCLAILLLEGVVAHIASANWDDLVEKAVQELSNGAPVLGACTKASELQAGGHRAYLYKFHGCATKAAANEAIFRPLLVATHTQVQSWAGNNPAMAARLQDLAATTPTFMIGLSAQDANIHRIFADAVQKLAWQWPGDRPSIVFSADKLGADQRSLTQNVYHKAITSENRDQILKGALVRAYAKPLLTALVLHVIAQKLSKMIDLITWIGDPSSRADLASGVNHLRNSLATAAQPDCYAFIKTFTAQTNRTTTLYKEGRLPAIAHLYRPLNSSPINQIAADHQNADSGERELAVLIALLGLGAQKGAWNILHAENPGPTDGFLKLQKDETTLHIYITANAHALLRLQESEHLSADADSILVHGMSPVIPSARHPKGKLGRTGRTGQRHVCISELLVESSNSNELFQNFRSRASI